MAFTSPLASPPTTAGVGAIFRCLLADPSMARWWVFFLSIGLSLGLAVPLSKATQAAETCGPEEAVARVVSVQGTVTRNQAPVVLNSLVCAGDVIWVASLSRAAVELFATDSVLRLDQQTQLRIPAPAEENRSLLDLIKGALYLFTREPRSLNVNSRDLNAAIEGTEFLVEIEPDQTFVTVFQGRVTASNEKGQITLESGQRGRAVSGQPPSLVGIVEPEDAVQWALHFQTVWAAAVDPLSAGPTLPSMSIAAGTVPTQLRRLEAVPEAERDADYHELRAALLLTVGRADEASAALRRALVLRPGSARAQALLAIIAVAENDREEALRLAAKAVNSDPEATVAWLALSYAEQARFDLDGALESVREALKRQPNNSLVMARLAELRLANGQLDKALETARKAVSLSPAVARSQTVLGFAFLTQIKLRQARQAFRRAIELDQADPLPRLGLGLTTIREGDLEAGRREIEIAVSLDPNRSLLRSYLGKAYFEEKREQLAETQYELAKILDPLDPTPWLYGAILKQTENRPVEALRNIQESIALNDNRAVYRSQLLLDADRAARGTSLARIYDDLGFERLALVEATKSLAFDPSNHSAHRFLSDTYANLPRHEIARVSELLQAQLLQPININPVQPQLTQTDISIVTRGGPASPGFNEFTPLFERNGFQFNASGVGGNNDTLGGEAVLSGIQGPVSFSAGLFHLDSDGFRKDRDFEYDVYNAFGQAALTPQLNVQFEYWRRESDQGDLRLNFDPDFMPVERGRLDQDTFRLGLRITPSRNHNILGSLIYSDRTAKLDSGVPDSVDFSTKGDQQGYDAQGQYLLNTDRFNLTVGGGIYEIDFDQRNVVDFSVNPPVCFFLGQLGQECKQVDAAKTTIDQHNIYTYANVTLPESAVWTLGFSYDAFDDDVNDLEELNPKLGLQWSITETLRLRAAALKTLKRLLIVNQTLEPTQIAGFNQFFDDFNGTRTELYGVGLDVKITPDIYGGLELSKRDLRVPVATQEDRFFDRDEHLYRAYFYWTPHDHWALSGEYRFERFEGHPTVEQLQTSSVPVTLRYFSPSRIFSQLSTTLVRQDIDYSQQRQFSRTDEDFVVVDAAIGYRLPKRLGIISLEAMNLFDEDFFIQDLGFVTSDPFKADPRFIPERTVLARFSLNF